MSSKRVAVRKARLLIGCLAVLCFARSAPSQYQFSSWSTEEGLPQNSIQAILQSRDGYLWLTTSDGLVRFDGVRFTVFERGSTAGLNSNRLTALFEDREGSLWIGTEDRGAIRYRHGTFTSFVAGEGSLPSPAISFTENREGNLLVNTGNGVFERRGEQFVPYPVEYDLPHAPGVASVGSAQYRAFSFYDRNGVHRYEDGRYKTYPVDDGKPEGRPKFVYQDQRGTLWISTLNKRLFKLKPDSSSVEEVKVAGGLSDHVVAVFEEDDRVVWLSTYATGLVRLENGVPTTYGEAEGYSANRTTRVFADREGNTWLGTHNTGLYQLSKRTVSAYTEAEGLSRDIIYTTYQDHEGTIWIGTWGAGLSSLKDGRFTNYTDIRNITGAFVTALFEDRGNALWVGSNNNGLSRLKDGKWTTFKRKDGLSNDSIYSILQDRTGALWIGTNGGLNRYQDGVFKTFSTDDGLAHKRTQVIYEDRAGTLWLGTLGGVSRFRDGVFTNITEKDGLSSNHVRSIYEDSEGVIWIGTYDGGLNRFKDGKITRYTTQDGLYYGRRMSAARNTLRIKNRQATLRRE